MITLVSSQKSPTPNISVPSVLKNHSFYFHFKGVAAGAANDGYLLIPGGPGATEIFRYIIEFSA